ncbi:MAG TPA: hypothetical protein EYP85_05850 [Armatimonadetes bacterium]|nr:hypothetical protein [Armatimonadota bacterium]
MKALALGNPLLPAALLSLAFAAPPLGGEEPPGTRVWDTGERVADRGVDLHQRRDWQLVPPGTVAYSFRGDAVLENERLMAVFAASSGGVLLYSKVVSPGEPEALRERMRLVLVSERGEPARSRGPVGILENAGEEAVLDVTFHTQSGERVRTAFRLRRGWVFLEVRPLENAGRVRLGAPVRFTLIPDFFGDDMVFDPQAYATARLFIPSENFLLGLREGGDSMLMSVWPPGEQEVEVRLAGEGEHRRAVATDISFDGQSVYVAILDAPGIWHQEKLNPARLDEDLALRWQRPFPAKWRTDFCAARTSHAWTFRNRRTDVWMYLYGPLVWPCWFDGERAFLRLSKRLWEVKGAVDFALIYPLERERDTPLTVYTPVDIVRETLGVGPCEYVLDREGLRNRDAMSGRRSFGRGVCDTTSVIEHLFMRGVEARESALVGHLVDDVLTDNRVINARIQEYRRFGQQMVELCRTIRQDFPDLKPLVDRVEELAREIETIYEENLPVIKTPRHAAALGKRVKELTQEAAPENLGECKALCRELRHIAGRQHTMIGKYRVLVKRLRQEAAIIGSTQPTATKMGQRIRDLARRVLRRKYGVEGE